MSHYLSNIAARNTKIDNSSLIPSAPVPEETETGSAPDNFQQPEFVQQSTTPVKSNEKRFIEPAVDINRMDAPQPAEHIELSYITKHIERVEAGQETGPAKDQPQETGSSKTVETSKINVFESTVVKSKENDPVIIDSPVSKIKPQKRETKKQTIEKAEDKLDEPVRIHATADVDEITILHEQIITPLVQNADHKKDKLQPNHSLTERITPNQPGLENRKQGQQNRTNQSTPKLVIGKIIVEVLPPITPVPPKVITKVLPSSSKAGHHKSNKLIFGLGQM